jgi:ketosteroid isomerase-like protein
MRKVLAGAVLAALAMSLAACGGSSTSSASGALAQREADKLALYDIEREWHKASSTKNVDLMMSLWAPGATFTIGPGQTLTGKKAIRQFFVTKAGPFQPQNHWISDTPAYKIRTTLDGDHGTVYFECHYVDVKTSKVVAVVGADVDVAKINGRWLITNSVGASPTLSP